MLVPHRCDGFDRGEDCGELFWDLGVSGNGLAVDLDGRLTVAAGGGDELLS